EEIEITHPPGAGAVWRRSASLLRGTSVGATRSCVTLVAPSLGPAYLPVPHARTAPGAGTVPLPEKNETTWTHPAAPGLIEVTIAENGLAAWPSHRTCCSTSASLPACRRRRTPAIARCSNSSSPPRTDRPLQRCCSATGRW